jgi:hypothetical protein
MSYDDENPFRRRYLYNDWWIVEWLPYILIALFVVGGIFFMTWCGDMAEQECREHGGDHMVQTGRYHSLCVSKDGRVIEW